MAITVHFSFKKKTASEWTSSNPILANGEMGIETDTKQFKLGDGITAWNGLIYGCIKGEKGDPGEGPSGPPGPNEITASTETDIDGLLRGNGSIVSASSLSESDLSSAVSLKHSNSLDHSNANDPSSGEKSALAGTTGTPGSGNKYVTDSDTRNTNARTPTTHSHAPGDVTGTAVITNDSRLSDARPASDVYTWAKAATKPTYTNTEVGAAAAAHGHPESEITNLVTDLASKTTLSAVKADADIADAIGKKHDGDAQDTAIAGKADVSHDHNASAINAGTMDGDRLPAMDATKKGGVPATGTPSGLYLKDDSTWGTPSAAPPDISYSKLAPAGSQTIPANCGVVIPTKYTIASGTKLTIGAGAIFRIQ